MGIFEIKSKGLTPEQITEAAEVLSGTVSKAYDHIKRKHVSRRTLANLDVATARNAKILLQQRRALAANIAELVPIDRDEGLSHLSVLEAVLQARLLCPNHPAHTKAVEDSAILEIQTVSDNIARLHTFGSKMIEEWARAEGEHYVSRMPGGSILGRVDGPSETLLSVEYDQETNIAGGYASWLLGVQDTYPTMRLYHRASNDPIARFALVDVPTTRKGIWPGYATFIRQSLGLGDRLVGAPDQLSEFVVGDEAVAAYIARQTGGMGHIASSFVRYSDPEIAAPELRRLLSEPEYADLAEIGKRVSMWHVAETDGKRTMSDRGRNWLRGLGVTG